MPATLKKPMKAKTPKKPTSKSKTGNTACSQAASNWQLSIRGKEALNPDTYATLAKCRAMTSTKKKAMLNEASGKLSAQGRQAIEGRLQKRFDSGLITQKSRTEKLKELLAARKAKQAPAAVKPVEAKAQPTLPPAQPPAFSRQGQLAPGRGTEERKQAAKDLAAFRKRIHGSIANELKGYEPQTAAKIIRNNNNFEGYGFNTSLTLPSAKLFLGKKSMPDSIYAPEFQGIQGDKLRSQVGQVMSWQIEKARAGIKPTRLRKKAARQPTSPPAQPPAIDKTRAYFPDGRLPQPRTVKPKEEPKLVWVDTGNPKESAQVRAMKGKLERMKGQFDNKFDDLVDQRRGGGGTPFITDTAKGRAEIKRSQKANESLSDLNKAIKQQEEKIEDAQFRYKMRHMQTKKSAEFIGRNEISPGLKYLQKTGAVKQWDRSPEFFFVPGLPKTALITVEGKVGVARRFAPKSPEDFNAAKRIASQANSIVKTANVVSNVRAKPGYAETRLMATQNKGRVSQGLRLLSK